MITLGALTLAIALAAGASAAPIRSSDPSTFFGGDAADIQDYLDWVATSTVDYKDTYFLPSSSGDAADGAAVHWSINEEQGILELAVAVRATGWLGFGLSENGGMTGSDMLIFEAADPDTVKDAYVKEERYPLWDDCQSWDFVSSSVDTEFLIVEVRREIDTLDNQDKLIHRDSDLRTAPQRIIAAWGDSPNMGYHGAKNARSTIRWYGQGEDESFKFHTMMEDQAVGSFRINIDNYEVPSDLTTYKSYCVTVDELKEHYADTPFDDGVTVVGLEAIVTSPIIHHYMFYASSTTDHLYDYPCWDPRAHPDLIYGYAPGEPPLIMPEGVGITVGGETGYKSFRLEIHYFNEENVRDQYDSSGIDMHFSLKPPMYEAGMTTVGDPFVRLLDQPVGQGLTEHIIECNSRCSLVDWGDTPSVTVYRENLHMHLTGTAMYSEHYRKGRGLIRKSRAEYYDFNQQGAMSVIQEPFELKRGDYFKLACFYRNSGNETVFGLGSADEMCINFLFYYPKLKTRGPYDMFCGLTNGFMYFGHPCDGTHYRVEDANEVEKDLGKLRSFGEPDSTSRDWSCPTS